MSGFRRRRTAPRKSAPKRASVFCLAIFFYRSGTPSVAVVADIAENVGNVARGDDILGGGIKFKPLRDFLHLLCGYLMHIARKADAPEHRRRQRPDDAAGVSASRMTAQIWLCRAGMTRETLAGDERNFLAFVRVRKTAHGNAAHAQRFDAASSRRAVFDDDAGNRIFQPREPFDARFSDLPAALAQTFGAVHAHADAVVIVDFNIFEPVFAQKVAHFASKVGGNFAAAQVKKAPRARRKPDSVARYKQLLAAVNFTFASRHFKLEPDARLFAALADRVGNCPDAVREEGFARIPISHGGAPITMVGLVPAGIDDEIFDGKIADVL